MTSDLLPWIILAIVPLVSFWLTAGVRSYAVKKTLLDVPNERSSHATPMPRGGGLAIVVTFLSAVLVLAWSKELSVSISAALLVSGFAVALIGWRDDLGHVDARWRLMVHFAASLWALICIGGLPTLTAFGQELELGWFGHGLALLYLVWALNFFNFMDGIDGLAGVETLTVCLGFAGIVLLGSPPVNSSALVLPLGVAAATIGFLVWNFPRARVFMGDVGSGFLGLVLAVLSIHAAWEAQVYFWCWLILLGAFAMDATVTLLRRLVRGARVYEAHRSHAYQHAAQRLNSHVSVSLAYGAINLFWLFPIAVLVAMRRVDGAVATLVAYAPLVVAAIWLKAGED